MSHAATNNEIIRMRPAVRKARVGVVWKLTKEAKLLKNRKHGDEKTITKCKRKAEKLVREIRAIKRVRDDDVTKFAILNSKSLQDVLVDPTADVVTRVMTRVAFHKMLKGAVEKFREKFPNYKLGKKQMKKGELKKCLGIEAPSLVSKKQNPQVKGQKTSEQNVKKTEKNSMGVEENKIDESDAENSSIIDEFDVENSSEIDEIEGEISPAENSEDSDGENEKFEAPKAKKRKITEENSAKSTKNPEKSKKKPKKSLDNLENHEKLAKSDEKSPKIEENLEKPSKSSKTSNSKMSKNAKKNLETSKVSESDEKPRKIKIVSKLAAVKRLKIGDSLEEDDEPSETVDEAPRDPEKLDLDTEVDSFFISGASDNAFKTVVLPKFAPPPEDDEKPGKNSNFAPKFAQSKNSNFPQKREFSKNSNFSSKFENSKNSNFPPKFENSKNFDRNGGKSKSKNFESSKKSRDKIEETVDLHPSWAARKKQQEAMKIGFQGKKIVFSDD